MPADEGAVATKSLAHQSEPSRSPDAAADHPARRDLRGRALDALALTLVLLLGGLFALRVVDWGVTPFEDAAMLMRYADNIAHGHGIVWNAGEAPVDGGTDFLFMIVVAAVHSIGISAETATQLVAIVAHFATLVVIYLGMRRVQGAGILPALVSAVYFAVCPGLVLAAAYFGTPLFALAVALSWVLAQKIMFAEEKRNRDMLYFSLACLVAGLVRPEGVLISSAMLLGVGVMLSARQFGHLAAVFAAIFFVLGGTYFVWRWNYFGYPLPNPFYVKGGGHLYPSALADSVRNAALLSFPFALAFLLSVRSRISLRLGVAFAIPIISTVGMWVFLSDEMNYGGRFQYPVLAIAVLSWYPLVKTVRADLRLPTPTALPNGRRIALIAMAGLCVVMLLAVQVRHSMRTTYEKGGVYDVAVALSQFADRNYTMATTEAGLLPLYSRWRAVDTWGLNDEWIAHNGGVSTEYLATRQPDLIMAHAVESSPLGPRWSRQTEVLREYAKGHQFTLAAAYGISPSDTYCYYVKPDIADHDAIVRNIQNINLSSILDGLAKNYAGRPESPC